MKRFHINLDDSAFTKERAPPKQLFQPSTAGGQSNTKASESPAKEDQPLSYAQYIIATKAQSSLQRDGTSEMLLSENCGAPIIASVKQSEPVEGTSKSDELTETEETRGSDMGQKDLNCPSLGPKPAGSGSSIVVSPRQRGNPILKFVRSVPWEFGEVVPDYVLGKTTCALFLSLRYHNLNPNYIHDRLQQLGHSFTLRVLLVQVDVKDPHHALKELARICIMADCTLILAWSPEEAGRYLETYKSYEKKPADLLKEQVEKNYLSKVTDCLTTVKSINKTDAMTLLSTFSSLEGIISASKEDLVLCPGLGPQKARRLYDVLHKPFLKSKTKCDS
ncbi:DNA excision repair protein ERCC-1 [Corythoichthys intestinalis]|uniref:DNA excision repair protein ERCC-1 n=1 Tax=Corythoichthys intestinalis TaxID=161448 RepID=UPI0025A63872|nr:DNA excision repair protein ERCC-1 [Corythoichthys intestinalis]XP_061799476.1 DNA excision repair protein ERCC-1-like [Nerophis lumbriciformis]